jgi:hypothetical protein
MAMMLLGYGLLAAGADRPILFTNESYVEDATRTEALPVNDPMAMFAFVLGSLPDRVKVYPTENYYYFSFVNRHTRYAGNIRLDVVDRDQGKLHFAYYQDLAEWKDEDPITHVILSQTQGVQVEKLDRLVYRISYAGKSVVFELNDLSQVEPPAGIFGPDEVYLGPIFDESAIRFFLVYDRNLKVFHYILDETVEVADQFKPAARSGRILIGQRTGFAFYRDQHLNRKILIGVFEGNARVNNYFDGPFDQLPDNFIKGDELRDAILAVEPQLTGRIDRYGISPGGEDRYLIGPYRHYRTEDDLMVFDACATSKRVPRVLYEACFVFDSDDNGDGTLRALTTHVSAARKQNASHRRRH